MKPTRALLAALSVIGVVAAGPVWSATAAASAAAQLKQDKARCISGHSNQPRDTCLREAQAAYAQALHGGLDDQAQIYSANAQERCDALRGEDRKACVARMRGKGTTSGSVEAGGVYRELTTRETQPAQPPAPAPKAEATPDPVR